jgi:hypothetical protein
VDVTVAVLTGRRPELLAATLTAFADRQPTLWEAAAKVVVHNTGDPATAEVLDRYPWDDRVVLDGRLRGIAEASQHLIKAVATADRRHVLRLEDDWIVTSTDFYRDAAVILDDRELNVGQVRLRLADEKVLPNHRVTRQPIRWRQLDDGHRWAPSAHYTHNPSLMRTWDYAAMAGYADEIDAARRYLQGGWSSAQHVPGAFRHAGDRDLGLSLKWTEGSS